MTEKTLSVYFNFRSPYCYIASKSLFDLFDKYDISMDWRPLGGWSGRSAPERAKIKIPLVRQDMRRITQRMAIPMNPPPPTTDPTKAGAASLYAQSQDKLREYVVEMMRAEWAQGLDIGDDAVIASVATLVGLDEQSTLDASRDVQNLKKLDDNAQFGEKQGVFGVPTFIVDDEIFWGSDRLDYLEEHLRWLRLSRN